jgi:hypothetical protein
MGSGSSLPANLGTTVELQVNGTPVATISVPVTIDGGGTVCADGPPCSGNCGTGSVNGQSVTLFCFKDGPCTPTPCDCHCGYWISSSFDEQPLQPGDEITVILYPAPGALPDDPSDNVMTTVFHGRPIGWNRAVEAVAFEASPAGGYDIRVGGSVGWEAKPGFLNLDFLLELRVNGTMRAMQGVPAEVDGIYDQTCFQNGCGASCGSVNGVGRYCDPYLWWDCGCVGGWISLFPGVALSPGDEITVILYPAPGALPELPPTAGDDVLTVDCCDAVSVGGGPGAPGTWSLGQNSPNPFSSATSIALALAEPGPVRVDVLDVSGRHVRTILDRTLTAATWSVTWDGTTDRGESAASGTYFCRVAVDGRTEMRRMVLVK